MERYVPSRCGLLLSAISVNCFFLRIVAHYSEHGYGKGSGFWVAEDDEGRVVGCVGLQQHGARAELRRQGIILCCCWVRSSFSSLMTFSRMSVAEQARRRGVSSQLIEHLMAHARTSGFSSVFCTTTTGQPAAIALYKKQGWSVVKTRPYSVFTFVTLEISL
jgi:N-acetylglutamate synthase-like GNAT family acetyltransferase